MTMFRKAFFKAHLFVCAPFGTIWWLFGLFRVQWQLPFRYNGSNARKSVRNEHISAGTFPNHLCFNYLGVYEPLTPSGGNKRGNTCFPLATAIRRDEKSNLGVKWPILGQNMKNLENRICHLETFSLHPVWPPSAFWKPQSSKNSFSLAIAIRKDESRGSF